MIAHERSLLFLAEEKKITIPFFQRAYVWEKSNWELLLEELLSFERYNFLGSIILKQHARDSGGTSEVSVIDGQQRLTTLSVLLKALYDLFPEQRKANCKSTFESLLFYKVETSDDEQYIKISHSHIDAPDYQSVITGADLLLPDKFGDLSKSESRIIQSYVFFVTELRRITDEEARRNLWNSLTNKDNKMLVVIDLKDNENEQAIFDTINSAGVRLSCADTVKNALFQKAMTLLNVPSQKGSKEIAIKLYNSTWKKTFLLDKKTESFWDTERATTRNRRDNIEILLHCYATIKSFATSEAETDSSRKLEKILKEKIESLGTLEEIKNLISEICQYAELYREHIVSFEEPISMEFSDQLIRLLHILDTQKITTFHPFILYVLNAKPEGEQNLLFNKLERMIIRRMITGDETRSYNKMCADLIADPAKLDIILAEQTDQEITTGICKIGNQPAKVLLFWIELYRRSKNSKFDVNELKYVYTLEHIMPQKWENYWTNIPSKTNPDGSAMSIEEAKKDRYSKVYSLGNMTLLTDSLNPSISNASFAVKMEGDPARRGKAKNGVCSYASLTITTNDIVAPYNNGDRVWDEDKITKRTEALGHEILSIWPGAPAPALPPDAIPAETPQVAVFDALVAKINADVSISFTADSKSTATTFRRIYPKAWSNPSEGKYHYEIYEGRKNHISVEFHVERNDNCELTSILQSFHGKTVDQIQLEFSPSWHDGSRLRLAIPYTLGYAAMLTTIGNFIAHTLPAIQQKLSNS